MAKKIIKAQMKQRIDTKANWASKNPVLLLGELGMVSDDPNLYKVGDGTTAWNALPFRGFNGTIVQETGTSADAVMSQQAMTRELQKTSNQIGDTSKAYTGDMLSAPGYIDASGNLIDYNMYSHSDKIPVSEGAEITCTCNMTSSVSCVALYGYDGAFKRSLVGKTTLATQKIVVEEGESFMILTTLNSNKNEFKVSITSFGLKGDLEGLSNKLKGDNETLDKALVRSTQILSHNVYNPAEAENGVYYLYNTGAKAERSDIASTGLIACKPGDVVYVFVGANNYGGNITFWDKNGKYLEGINASSSGWTVPDNQQIAYFRASFYNSVFSRLCININEKYADDTYRENVGYFSEFPITSPNINDLQGSLESTLRPSMVVLSHNLYNPADAERGLYYQWNTGAKIERSDISSTGLIACKANDKVFVFRLQARYGGNITFWDKDQKYISGVDVIHGGDVSTPSFVVPDNDDIAFFRSSFYTDIIESLCVNINEKYADDVYREEKAYQATLPIYAPNLGKKNEEEIAKYYTMTRDSVTSIYGRNNTVGSSFILSVVAKTNYEGQLILPRLKGTSETSALGDANITTVIAYAKKHNYQHTINAGIYLVDNNTADGTTIINGQILKDGACEQFTTNQYVLGIKADGTMKAYRNVSAQAIINDGCIDAVMGFVPLVEDGIPATDSVLNICPHANIRHPRQIIGILTTGDYFTFFCDGRTDNENGMTLRECVDTITNLVNVQFAFNLDGGGSSQSVTYHKQINRMLDGRKVPNVIAFVE